MWIWVRFQPVRYQYEYEPFSRSFFHHKEETGNITFQGTDGDLGVREPHQQFPELSIPGGWVAPLMPYKLLPSLSSISSYVLDNQKTEVTSPWVPPVGRESADQAHPQPSSLNPAVPFSAYLIRGTWRQGLTYLDKRLYLAWRTGDKILDWGKNYVGWCVLYFFIGFISECTLVTNELTHLFWHV